MVNYCEGIQIYEISYDGRLIREYFYHPSEILTPPESWFEKTKGPVRYYALGLGACLSREGDIVIYGSVMNLEFELSILRGEVIPFSPLSFIMVLSNGSIRWFREMEWIGNIEVACTREGLFLRGLYEYPYSRVSNGTQELNWSVRGILLARYDDNFKEVWRRVIDWDGSPPTNGKYYLLISGEDNEIIALGNSLVKTDLDGRVIWENDEVSSEEFSASSLRECVVNPCAKKLNETDYLLYCRSGDEGTEIIRMGDWVLFWEGSSLKLRNTSPILPPTKFILVRDGKVLWRRTLNVLLGKVITMDDGIYVIGIREQDGVFRPVMVKLSYQGEVLWMEEWNERVVIQEAIPHDGVIYLTGYVVSGRARASNVSSFIMAYDGDGNLVRELRGDVVEWGIPVRAFLRGGYLYVLGNRWVGSSLLRVKLSHFESSEPDSPYNRIETEEQVPVEGELLIVALVVIFLIVIGILKVGTSRVKRDKVC